MILEALRVLLFGMLGIFVVMAIIYGVIVLLSKISARFSRAEAEESVEIIPLPAPPAAIESVEAETAQGDVEHEDVEYEYVDYETGEPYLGDPYLAHEVEVVEA